jgi:hypothetical protein
VVGVLAVVSDRAHYRAPLIGLQLQVEDQHEIEGAWLGSVIQQVGSDLLGAHLSLCCKSSRFLESGPREVDSRHVPPALREPVRFATFAAGEVEGAARRQARRFATRNRLGFTVQMNSLAA